VSSLALCTELLPNPSKSVRVLHWMGAFPGSTLCNRRVCYIVSGVETAQVEPHSGECEAQEVHTKRAPASKHLLTFVNYYSFQPYQHQFIFSPQHPVNILSPQHTVGVNVTFIRKFNFPWTLTCSLTRSTLTSCRDKTFAFYVVLVNSIYVLYSLIVLI